MPIITSDSEGWKINPHFAIPPYSAEEINGYGIIRNKNGYNCAEHESGAVLFPSQRDAEKALKYLESENAF